MMKNKKLWFKLLLDGLMLIALTLLFWKENFGMSFHEIVGVSVLGAFLLHLILNWRWVCRITGRFFSRGMTARARVGYLVDAGLLVCFAVIGFSGICMSRTLFRLSVEGNWKTPHYFCSALALILVGVHLGMHFTLIANALRSRIRLRPLAGKAAAICLGAAVIAVGVYAVQSTSFSQWLNMPFQTRAYAENRVRPSAEGEEGARQTAYAESEQSAQTERQAQTAQSEESREKFQEGSNRRSREGGHGGGQSGVNAAAIIWKAAQYAAISLMIGIFTWGVERLARRGKAGKIKTA